MRSGGYALSKQIRSVQQECLVVWGEDDEVLDPKFAKQFSDTLPKSQLAFIEECGHSPHIEKPQKLAELVLDFVTVDRAADVHAHQDVHLMNQ